MYKFILAISAVAVLIPSASGQRLRMKAKLDTYGCESRDFMLKFKDALLDGDRQAAYVATVSMGVASDCVEVLEGNQVVSQGVELLAGLLKFRKPGYLGTYYGIRNFFEIDNRPPAPVRPSVAPKPDPPKPAPPKRSKPKPAPSPTAMTGGWKCLEPGELSHRAENTSQRLTLTRTTMGATILGFAVTGSDVWVAADLKVDGEKTIMRTTRLNRPEIDLDPELTDALKRGRSVAISVWPKDGNESRYSASLIGFTRAYNCVMQLKHVRPATEEPKVTSAKDVEQLNKDIQTLAGRILALRLALDLTIHALSSSVSVVSSDPEAASKAIRNSISEGFRETAEKFSDTEAKSEDARYRIRGGAKLLGELADGLSK